MVKCDVSMVITANIIQYTSWLQINVLAMPLFALQQLESTFYMDALQWFLGAFYSA